MVRDLSSMPHEIQLAFSQLTMVEEMLLSPVLPIMSVMVLKTGQTVTSGFTANFRQSSLEFVKTIPRLAADVAILVIKRKDQQNNTRECRVNRSRIELCGKWLINNNPQFVQTGVVWSESNADLIIDGILPLPELEADETAFTEGAEEGPVEEQGSEEEEGDENVQAFVEGLVPNLSEIERVGAALDWPAAQTTAINEWESPGLASLAFVKLFPLGQADPTVLVRVVGLSESEAASHLLKYAEIHPKTGKLYYPFASHPRFSFWMNDRIRRHRALKQADVYLKNNPSDEALSIEEIASAVQDPNNAIWKRMSAYSANLTGTESYWYQRRQELEAIFKQKGPGTVFFTFSFADCHWEDLHRLMPEGLMPPKNRSAIARKHPHLCDWYFSVRIEEFVSRYFTKVLDVDWIWYRYEWQSRTSIHAHGTCKLKSDPGLCKLVATAYKGHIALREMERLRDSEGGLTEDDRATHYPILEAGKKAQDQVHTYCDTLLTAMNPRKTEDRKSHAGGIPDPHPCSISLLPIIDDDEALNALYEELVNCCQRHVCRPEGYCKSTKNVGGCRFDYPFECEEDTELRFDESESKVRARIDLKRNDPYLNVHNRTMLQNWGANVDMQIILDYHAAVSYMVKYASKGEKEGRSLASVCRTVMQYASAEDNPKTKLRSMMLRHSERRDVGMGETSRMLMGGKHCVSSFKFVKQSLESFSQKLTRNEDGELALQENLLHYWSIREELAEERPDLELEKLDNLTEFIRHYVTTPNGLAKRRNPDKCVVITYPNIKATKSSPNYGKYCRLQILRYGPWTHQHTTDMDNDDYCIDWWEDLVVNDESLLKYGEMDMDLQTQLQAARDESLIETEVNEELRAPGWMALSDMRPSAVADDPSTEIEIDMDYDWSANLQELYTEEQIKDASHSWVMEKKQLGDATANASDIPVVDIERLNHMQRIWFDYTCKCINENTQSLLIVNGTAGTGKSFTISAISQAFREDQIVRCAFTATAANLIQGRTIHSLFKIPVSKKKDQPFLPLGGKALKELQEIFQHICLVIIDEYSMLSSLLLSRINSRMKQITGKVDEMFGGISVTLVGDPAQLLPVGGSSLYTDLESPIEQDGFQAYRAFNDVIILTESKRQQNEENNPSQQHFIDLLNRLRSGICEQNDWEFLMTMTPSRMGSQKLQEFDDAVRLFATNAACNDYNERKLIELNRPITRINAVNSHARGKSKPADEFRGIANALYLTIGAKVMMTTNMWTEAGLTNGAFGTVRDIVYLPDQSMPGLPAFILIEFKNYTGPAFMTDPTKAKYVPISVCEFSNEDFSLTRRGFPIKLAFAMTIHKVQGQTLEKAVVDLGSSESSLGMTFVALSRVPYYTKLAVKECPYSRLFKIRDSISLAPRLREEERLQTLSAQFIERWNDMTAEV